MIFGFIILVLVVAIVFFHYMQGIFSATISAIVAVLAASLAVGWHEWLVASLLGGKMADQATAITLVGLFVIIYLVLRVLFDQLVPGNVRVPVLMDKIGGAAMGLVAAIFATGVVAVAAQSMPFGPSIAGYARYTLVDSRPAVVSRDGRQAVDAEVVDEMKNDSFERSDEHGLMIPVDDMLVGMVGHLSDGALAGSQSFRAVHPDWLTELFGNRLGIQVGAKRTAINTPQRSDASVAGVYQISSVQQTDADPSVRTRELPARVDVGDDKVLLVVRVMLSSDASDDDGIVRFSPASVRLVTPGGESGEPTNHYPIGTLEKESKLYANRIDDPLFVAGGKGADLVFLLDRAAVLAPAAEDGAAKVLANTFLEVKRLAAVDLSNRPVPTGVPSSDRVSVMRKKDVK